MRLRLVLIATLLLATAAAKYEDNFGRTFDWKRPGQSRLVDSIVGTESTLLLVEEGIIVKDISGKTKHSVDLQYADHAIDKKSQKLYLLASNRLQLHEFHSVTGKFVQTIQTEEGGRLYVVYAHSVYSSQGGQSLAQASKKFKNDEVLIDTNGHFVLLKKGDKYCIDVFGRPDKKEKPREDARKCLSSDKLTYYYPSETGFWFISGKTDNLIHLSDTIAEHVIASKKFKPVHYRGITNNFAAMEAFTTDIFFLEGKSLKRGDTIDKSCVADSNVLFSSEANSDYWGLTCYRSGKEEGDIDFVSHEIFKGRSKKAVTANTIKVHGGITNIWVCNSIGKNHPMIISYTNGEYIQYNEGGKKQWARIPDLEDSVDVLAADFPSETVSQEIPQYDSYGKNFIGAFIYRVVTDCQNLVNFATSLLPRLAGFNFQELVNKVLGKESSKIENLNYYNKHGLRKNLIFVTKSNKLVSVSSMDGKTLWTLTLKPGQAIVRAMINSQNNIDLIYEEEGKKKRTEISSLEGKFISQDLPVDPKAKVFLEGASDLPPIEIGFSDHYLKNSNQNMVFYRIEKDKGVFGYRWTSDGRFEEIWNVLFEPSQTILDYSYHMKGNNDYVTKSTYGFLSALPEGEDMLFKVVDSGNIALLIKQTINGKESMEIVILNTARGKILGRFSNPAVDFSHPIAFIFDDNGVYASYMNSRLATYELWSIELMMTRIESSFIEMIQTYVLKAKKRDPIDYNADKPQFVILDRKYGLPVGLKYLGAVNTRQGLTKRNLIGITTTNDVVSLDRMLISARRNTIEEIEKINARTKKLPNYYSNVYPPYMYYLPLTPLANLNAHWRLSGIEKLKVIDTKFESTSLVVAYGKDVFVTRIQPDQTFDLLHEDFNSTLLVLACIAITVGFLIIKILVFVLRKISRSSEAKKRYLGA